MKKTAYLLVIAVLLCAAPVFAQGPFNDVPTDHWAYDAVNQLQKDGIIIGYPDGTFGGKRAMSRYEFAVAIARLAAKIPPVTEQAQQPAGVSRSEVESMLAPYALKSEIPNVANFATKADVEALRKLIDEFRDELAALGVDVDCLKRDVAALGARVAAIEAEQKRVRFNGDVNVFAVATASEQGAPVDQDQRFTTIPTATSAKRDTLMRTIGVVKDFDLNVVGRVSDTTTARATINYGNYLNYLGFVDDYIDGARPTAKGGTAVINGSNVKDSLSDTFFPYYLYISAGLCKGSLSVGRFPLQFTPYTLKKIDVDSYTSILKTDDGNYPVDGVKLGYTFSGVDVTLFAVKNNENDFLVNGLTGQPSVLGIYGGIGVLNPINAAGGHSVGGLRGLITQSAGARVTFGTPWKGIIGATYYQAWSEPLWETAGTPGASPYDQAQVFGGDITVPFGSNFGFAGSWTQSNTLASDRAAGVADINSSNTAWDARINAGFGKLGLAAGYKRIERNFAAAGAWDKIGRWTNPVNVLGPYVNFTYPIASKLKFALDGEFLKTIDTIGTTAAPAVVGLSVKDDEILRAEAGLRWGISRANALDLGYEWIQYSPKSEGLDDANETYLTLGWAHQVNPNAGFKIAYQIMSWNGGVDHIIYGPDYRGGIGVVQMGVSF